jgi:hypothetical protein
MQYILHLLFTIPFQDITSLFFQGPETNNYFSSSFNSHLLKDCYAVGIIVVLSVLEDPKMHSATPYIDKKRRMCN